MAKITQSIASGAQVPTTGAPLGGGLLVGIYFPAWNKTANAALEASLDNSTFAPILQEDGTDLVVVPDDTACYIQIDPPIKAEFFRVNADVNQGAARTLTLYTI